MRTLILTAFVCAAGCGGESTDTQAPVPTTQPRRLASPDDGRLVHFSAPGGRAGPGAVGRERWIEKKPPTEPKLSVRKDNEVIQNQESVVKALWEIGAAQTAARVGKLVDVDGDDDAEYLFLSELLGSEPVRGGTAKFEENDRLVTRFGQDVREGRIQHAGYLFQIFLPGPNDTWITDTTHNAKPSSVAGWRCYAWPLEYGETGRLVYYIDQTNEIYASNNQRTTYDGFVTTPEPNAAVGLRSDLHADDAFLGADSGWWSRVFFTPVAPGK